MPESFELFELGGKIWTATCPKCNKMVKTPNMYRCPRCHSVVNIPARKILDGYLAVEDEMSDEMVDDLRFKDE